MGLLGLESGTCNTTMFDVSCQINTGKNMFSFCLSLSPLQNYGYDGNTNIDHLSITSLTSQSCSSNSDYVNYYVQRKNQMRILVLLVLSVKSPLENNTTGQVFAWYQNSPLNPALKNLVSCGFRRGQFKTRTPGVGLCNFFQILTWENHLLFWIWSLILLHILVVLMDWILASTSVP